MIEALTIVSLAILIGCIFMWFRNNWVYNRRMEIIDESDWDFLEKVSYNEMFYKFWIWNVDKFRKS